MQYCRNVLLAAVLFPLTALADVSTSFEYDANGNLTKVTDGLQHATTYQYDALNRRVQATDALNGVTLTTYDLQDHVTGVTDPRNLTTTYQVNAFGEVTARISPDTGTAIYQYDAAGRITARTDAKGNVASYTYDAIGRPLTETHTPVGGGTPLTVTYTYDQGAYAMGRLSAVSTSSGVGQAYTYDEMGRTRSVTDTADGRSFVTQYAYDSYGRLAAVTYPSGRVAAYGRDAAGRINSISLTMNGAPVGIVSNIQYTATGQVAGFSYANGQTYTRGYDLSGRVASYRAGSATRTLTYDDADNITAIQEGATPVATAGYDALNRITNFTGMAAHSFTYDAVGNRTSKDGIASTYAAASNRLDQANGSPVVHDANGSVTAKGGMTFDYDSRGRLSAAHTAQGSTTYLVDPFGKRVMKANGPDKTYYHYDQAGQIIGESDAAGQFLREYVWLAGQPVYLVKGQGGTVTTDDVAAVFTGPWSDIADTKATGGSYKRLP